jgi:hypothetical protein
MADDLEQNMSLSSVAQDHHSSQSSVVLLPLEPALLMPVLVLVQVNEERQC